MNTKNTTIKIPQLIAIASFAVFAMFFGSGNLVFPLIVGTHSIDNGLWAAAGILLTGVLLPLIGLIAILLYTGDPYKYWSTLGRPVAWLLGLLTFSLLGPLGVGPRSILVSYGGVHALAPSIPLPLFGLAFLGVVGFIIARPNALIDRIGTWLTPVLLAGIAVLVWLSLRSPDAVSVATSAAALPRESLKLGLTSGYQSLDLLGGAVVAPALWRHVNAKIHGSSHNPLRISLLASCIGLALMGIVYSGFVLIGAKHAASLVGIPHEGLLLAAAHEVLGAWATPWVAVLYILACLTTACATTEFFAEFIAEHTPLGRWGKKPCVGIALALTYAMSLLGFSGLTVFLATILTFIYPALGAFACVQIITQLQLPKLKAAQLAFWGTLALVTIIPLFNN
ncbi:MAG TPA: branched-chain amino acid transport system II carrier protein [Opitutales bacterium]|nr:branched-chain amino acid transport system II carrier protein [Opitutales bacterium]